MGFSITNVELVPGVVMTWACGGLLDGCCCAWGIAHLVGDLLHIWASCSSCPLTAAGGGVGLSSSSYPCACTLLTQTLFLFELGSAIVVNPRFKEKKTRFKEKADNLFVSVFLGKEVSAHSLQTFGLVRVDWGSNIPLTVGNLNIRKSMGSDEMHPRALRELGSACQATLYDISKVVAIRWSP